MNEQGKTADSERGKDISAKPNDSSGEIDSRNRHGDVSPDDTPRIDALREAARQHGDTFIVKSDLEDKEQREASPGTREQD